MKQLPIRVQPNEHESGHGFLLRALHRNGLRLSQAATWLGLRWNRSVRGQDHVLWAWATGVDTTWLRERLPQSRKNEHGLEHDLLRHHWRGAHSLRITVPQVCPVCIRELGYCQASWDLMAMTACPHHRALLVDRCAGCKQYLSWNRPAVEICTCKRFITGSADRGIEDEDLVWKWTAWLASRVHRQDGASHDLLLPGLPSEVTPDGAYRIALALGMRVAPDQCLKPRMWNHHMSPRAVQDVLGRGLRRLASGLANQDWPSFRRLAHEQTLERLEAFGLTSADQSIARRIRRAIFGLEKKGDPALRPKAKGQLELFLGES